MTDSDLIERLARAVAQHIIPPVPRDIELWDFNAIGAYVRRSGRYVREEMAVLPSFPKAIKLPSSGARAAHPLYLAEEVIDWVVSHREKKKAA